MNSFIQVLSLSRRRHVVLHPNTHQSATPVPSVGCLSAMCSRFSFLFPSLFFPTASLLLNVFVQILNRGRGQFVRGGQTARSPSTPHLLLRLLFCCSDATSRRPECQSLPLNLVLSSLTFHKRHPLLPSANLPCDPSLFTPLLSLYFSLSLKYSTPERPTTPSSPWDLE